MIATPAYLMPDPAPAAIAAHVPARITVHSYTFRTHDSRGEWLCEVPATGPRVCVRVPARLWTPGKPLLGKLV